MDGSVRICRICLLAEPATGSSRDSGTMVSVFSEREPLGEVAANMIIDCFSVLVSEQDGYSPWMCAACMTKLEFCYLLRNQYLDSCRKVDERRSELTQNVVDLPESIIDEDSIIEKDSNIEQDSVIEDESIIDDGDIIDAGTMIEEANIIEEDPMEEEEGEEVQHFNIPETPSDSANESDSEQSTSEFQEDVHYKVIEVNGVTCCDCNEIFPDEESLIQHSESDHKPQSTELKLGLLQCDICYSFFASNRRLETHIKRRYSQNLLECLECQAIFRNNTRLQSHLIKHDRKSSRTFEDHLCCARRCTATFPTQDQLIDHAKKIHGPLRSINKSTRDSDNHVCQVCLKCFQSQQALIKHRFAKRDNPQTAELVCSTCGLTFKAMSLLKAHENKHKGINPFPCNQCSQSFHSHPKLQRHKRRFHVDKHRHQCPDCPKSFTHKSQLKSHLVYHLDLKPYKCETCSESFRLKSQLVTHSRRHTGERPHRCQYCQMGFAHQTDRKRHEMAAHTKERPHKCRICRGAFVRHQQLVSHMVSAHGRTRDAPFRCELCPETFRQSSQLEWHEQLTHGIQDVGTILADDGVEMQYAVEYE